jgi:hypothetical protein
LIHLKAKLAVLLGGAGVSARHPNAPTPEGVMRFAFPPSAFLNLKLKT